VLLDATVLAASRRALAAQTKPHLVNGHFVAAAELRSRQLERGGHAGAASPDHGYFGPRLHGIPVI
jgi:hypothetical protein